MRADGALWAALALFGVAVAMSRRTRPPADQPRDAPSPDPSSPAGRPPAGPRRAGSSGGASPSASTGGSSTGIDVVEAHGVAMYGHGAMFVVTNPARWDDWVAFTLSNLGGVPPLPTLVDAQELTVSLWRQAFPAAELDNETVISGVSIAKVAEGVFDYMQRHNDGQPSTRNSHMRGVAAMLRGRVAP